MGSLGDALAGKINGLHVSLSGGRPGSTPSLQIRQSSVNTTITPSSDLEVMQALLHYMLLMALLQMKVLSII